MNADFIIAERSSLRANRSRRFSRGNRARALVASLSHPADRFGLRFL